MGVSTLVPTKEMDIVWNSRKCRRYGYVKDLIDRNGSGILFKADRFGFYPIHWAVGANGNPRVVELMIKEGVSPSMKALIPERTEPIHLAALEGNIAVIDLLVSHAIDVNVTDGSGCTPLMRASMFGNNLITKSSETVLHLISYGADPKIQDSQGLNCLHYAVLSNNQDTVHLLLNLGMDPNVRTDSGQRALDLAATIGSEYLMRILAPLTQGVSRPDLEILVIKFKKKERREKLTRILTRLAQMVVLLAVFTALFYAYPQYLVHYMPSSLSYIPLHFCLIASNAIVWISWYKTCVSDPGYLAQNTVRYTKVLTNKLEFGILWKTTGQRPDDPYSETRLCHICRTVRSHRSSHCRHCMRCTAGFDHHCIYLSTCIGQNNRRAFFALGLSILMSGVLSAGLVFIVASDHDSVFTPYHWFNFLYCLQYVLVGFLLTICNLRRAAINLTQYEELKRWKCRFVDPESQSANPYDKGSYWRNLVDYFTAHNYRYAKLNLRDY